MRWECQKNNVNSKHKINTKSNIIKKHLLANVSGRKHIAGVSSQQILDMARKIDANFDEVKRWLNVTSSNDFDMDNNPFQYSVYDIAYDDIDNEEGIYSDLESITARDMGELDKTIYPQAKQRIYDRVKELGQKDVESLASLLGLDDLKEDSLYGDGIMNAFFDSFDKNKDKIIDAFFKRYENIMRDSLSMEIAPRGKSSFDYTDFASAMIQYCKTDSKMREAVWHAIFEAVVTTRLIDKYEEMYDHTFYDVLSDDF